MSPKTANRKAGTTTQGQILADIATVLLPIRLWD